MDEEAQNYDPDALTTRMGRAFTAHSDTTVCELLTFDGNGDGMVNYQDFSRLSRCLRRSRFGWRLHRGFG